MANHEPQKMAGRALILFAHGARDPAWMAPFLRLQTLLQTQQPGLTVKLAFLELMTPDLPQLIATLRLAYPDLRLQVVAPVGEDADVLDAMAQYCLRSLPV